MPDGMRLPYRTGCRTAGPEPWAVVLALHGMNDSRDAWEYPGARIRRSRDRGVRARPARLRRHAGARLLAGRRRRWSMMPREMARAAARRYPRARLILMGESMGARGADAPGHPRRIRRRSTATCWSRPAVWGRAEMNVFLRTGLWLVSNLVPGLTVTGSGRAGDRERQPRGADPAAVAGPADHPRHPVRHDAGPGRPDGRRPGRRAAVPCAGAIPLRRQGRTGPGRGDGGHLARLPAGPVRAFYPDGYHLLLRDHERQRRSTTSWPGCAHPGCRCRPAPTGRRLLAWQAKQD